MSDVQKLAATDDPRGLHDGLGGEARVVHRLPEAETPLLDHVYCGDAFPKLNEGDPHYLRPETIAGAFAVESWLEDHLGRYGAVVNNGEGRRWVVFELEHLERCAR